LEEWLKKSWYSFYKETFFEKLRGLGYDLPEKFALFPPVILDRISSNWLLEAGNDLLACYHK
jgi:hypothetical protein